MSKFDIGVGDEFPLQEGQPEDGRRHGRDGRRAHHHEHHHDHNRHGNRHGFHDIHHLLLFAALAAIADRRGQ